MILFVVRFDDSWLVTRVGIDDIMAMIWEVVTCGIEFGAGTYLGVRSHSSTGRCLGHDL